MTADWCAPFRTLRDEFLLAARQSYPAPHVALTTAADWPTAAALIADDLPPPSAYAVRHERADGGYRVWGVPAAVRVLLELAAQAGANVPTDLHTTRAIFDGPEPVNLGFNAVQRWLEFLFVAEHESFTVITDPAQPANRVTFPREKVNVFRLSATAIDRFLLTNPPPIRAFFDRIRVKCRRWDVAALIPSTVGETTKGERPKPRPERARREALYERIRQLYRDGKKEAAILDHLKSPAGKDLMDEVQREISSRPKTKAKKPKDRRPVHVVRAALRPIYVKGG